MDAKTCRQCGELKPISQYRRYYGGRQGSYTTCRQCEKINSRLKYLESKEVLTEPERIERDKILKLYEAQQSAGLRPPRRGGRRTELVTDLDAMLERYQVTAAPELGHDALPHELHHWLTCDLTDDPDVYINEIYETLCERFRPATAIDKNTMMPTYDETYKDVLSKILQRFYDYEDSYYEQED